MPNILSTTTVTIAAIELYKVATNDLSIPQPTTIGPKADEMTMMVVIMLLIAARFLVDGSNVAVAKLDEKILPLTRAGYLVETSPFEQHHFFAYWISGTGE